MGITRKMHPFYTSMYTSVCAQNNTERTQTNMVAKGPQGVSITGDLTFSLFYCVFQILLTL